MEISTSTCPCLSEGQVKALRGNGISKLLDILTTSKMDLMSKGMLTLSLTEVLIKETVAVLQPPPAFGTNFAMQHVRNGAFHATGVPGLDAALGGGLEGGEVLEVFGEIGTGKTQMCMMLSAHFLKSGYSVIYFDLKCCLSAKRLLTMCDGNKQLLSNIWILRPSTMADAMEDVAIIEHKLREMKEDFMMYKNLKLVIFDSLPTMVYPVVSETPVPSWRYQLENLVEKVFQLSRANDGLVIVFANHSTTNRNQLSSKSKERSGKAALGVYWRHKPNFRIQLSKTDKLNVFQGVIQKSCRTASGTKFSFKIP